MDLPPFPPAAESALAEALAVPGRLSASPALWREAGELAPLRAIGLSGAAGAAEDGELLLRLWLARHGEHAASFGAWFNLGALLLARGERAEAADAFAAALRRRPDLHAASVNLGLALEQQGAREQAIEAWRRALPPPELRRALHTHLGRSLEEAGRLAEAAEELRAALLIEPDQPDVQQHWLHLRQRMAAWPVLEPAMPGLPERVQAMNVGPLGALALHEDPAAQREVAAAWLARKVPAAPERLAPEGGYPPRDRIRLGYLSSDFCRHAVSLLMAGVFERHDRGAFEVFGYDTAPADDGSDVRARVLAALDHHRPCAALGDEAAARLIRADEIDVLVDLNGLTRGARPGILRWKPAPAQATYLGYIGSVPLPELDWLLCDAVSIPEAEEAHYAPRPLRIEGCYQANDDRAPELPSVSREGEGLPERGVVFACFSHHYKITPAVFAAWAEVMRRAGPDSVLWLLDGGPESRANLFARWAEAGLAAERLLFAPRAEPAHYLARLGLADLFLDTWPCNAGAAASDALRMGVPIVTLAGRAFAGRMAASLLTSVGLADTCVARDAEDYVRRAVVLAGNGAARAAMRAHLTTGGAWARSLGNTEDFVRRFEAALKRMVLRP